MDLTCPYCGEERTIELPSKKSVAIAVCLQCTEVIVIYKQHAVALDRNVLANGSTDEKRQHIASMIMEFAQQENGWEGRDELFASLAEGPAHANEEPTATDDVFCLELLDSDRSNDDTRPITVREVADFRRIDLNLIDDAAYFDHVFGQAG